MNGRIAIINYGGGNIGSVKNALDSLKIKSIITDDIQEIQNADKIILPGQGRFGDVMKKLRKKGLDKILINEINNGKPYLGICVGLQILFDSGDEDPVINGLGLISGTIPKFSENKKIPQIGWNSIIKMKDSKLLKEINSFDFFYFVHSYYCKTDDKESVLTQTKYGQTFVSAIEKNNMMAVQFHPEKSGESGLKLLKNFGDI
jgi:imidazole glycerol-phosphate synthase subunit HisH